MSKEPLPFGVELVMFLVYLTAVFAMGILSAGVCVGVYRLLNEWGGLTPTQTVFAWAGGLTALMALRYPLIRNRVEKER